MRKKKSKLKKIDLVRVSRSRRSVQFLGSPYHVEYLDNNREHPPSWLALSEWYTTTNESSGHTQQIWHIYKDEDVREGKKKVGRFLITQLKGFLSASRRCRRLTDEKGRADELEKSWQINMLHTFLPSYVCAVKLIFHGRNSAIFHGKWKEFWRVDQPTAVR